MRGGITFRTNTETRQSVPSVCSVYMYIYVYVCIFIDTDNSKHTSTYTYTERERERKLYSRCAAEQTMIAVLTHVCVCMLVHTCMCGAACATVQTCQSLFYFVCVVCPHDVACNVHVHVVERLGGQTCQQSGESKKKTILDRDRMTAHISSPDANAWETILMRVRVRRYVFTALDGYVYMLLLTPRNTWQR